MRQKYFVRNFLFNLIIFLQLIFIPLPLSNLSAESAELDPLAPAVEDFRQDYFDKGKYGDVYGFTLEEDGKLKVPNQCAKDGSSSELHYEIKERDPQNLSKISDFEYYINMILGMVFVSMAMSLPVRCKKIFMNPSLSLIFTGGLTYVLNHFDQTKKQVHANALAQSRMMPITESGEMGGSAELAQLSMQMNLVESTQVETEILRSRANASWAISGQLGGALAAAIFGNGLYWTSKMNPELYTRSAAETSINLMDAMCSQQGGGENDSGDKVQQYVGKVLVAIYESVPMCLDQVAREMGQAKANGDESVSFLKSFSKCSLSLKTAISALTGGSGGSLLSGILGEKAGGIIGDGLEAYKTYTEIKGAKDNNTSYHGYNRLVQKYLMDWFLTANYNDQSDKLVETKQYIRLMILLGAATTLFTYNAAKAESNYKRAKDEYEIQKCEFERLYALAPTAGENCPDCGPLGLAAVGGDYAQNLQSQLKNYRRKQKELESGLTANDFKLCMGKDYSLTTNCKDPGELQMMNKNHLSYPALGSFYNDSMGYANALNNNNFGAAQKFASNLAGHKSAINARVNEGKKRLNDYMQKNGKKNFDFDKEVKKHIDDMRAELMKLPAMQDLKKTLDNKAKITAETKKAQAEKLKNKKSKFSVTKHTAGASQKSGDGEGMFGDFDMGDYSEDENVDQSASGIPGEENSLADFEISNNTIHDRPETSIFEIVHTRYLLNYDKVLKKKQAIKDPEEPMEDVKTPK